MNGLDTERLDDPAALAALVLDEELRRHEEQDTRAVPTAPETEAALPELSEMPLRAVLSQGGRITVTVLSALALLDALDNAAFGVLAPNIQKSLGMSTTVLAIIGALAGFTVTLAAIPFGTLGDRSRRTLVAGVSTILWAVASVFTGLAQATWQLITVRTVSGLGKANEGPIHGSILTDAYPPEGRGRIFGIYRSANPLGLLIGPALAGGIASAAGGSEGWRWSFAALALPAAVLGLVALFVPEPKRGKYEQISLLGDELEVRSDDPPISMSAAFTRLKKVRTFSLIMGSLGAFGFGVTTIPIYLNVLLTNTFHLSSADRGVIGSISAVGAIVGAVIGGRYSDKLYRDSPAKCLWLMAGAVGSLGIGLAIQAYAPSVWVFTLVGVISQGLLFAGLVPIGLIIAAIVPYQFRAMGFALVGLYLSLIGGLGGAILTASLLGPLGTRGAIAAVAPASSLVAAGLLLYACRFVEGDIAMAAADVVEERDERARIAAGGELPLLQVRHLDFSYGSLQVLFDVNLDVREGEVLALLGTNGAGKSTLLRAVSGLDPVDRGVVRMSGRTITYASAEDRVRLGVVQVPGGRSVFPSLSVEENLVIGGFTLLDDPTDLEQRIDHVLTLFPILAERLAQPAGTLSGGEQQMLGLAMAMLLKPRLLLIDELSLGLAPVVVQQMLDTVERLKADGLTMVIVEQSVNVALSIADRAVFMEKGQVRFEGPAAELMERDDLVRAVFLGGEGG